MDKDRANDLLRYGIKILRGEGIVSTGLGRIHLALILKQNLEEMGAWWQVKILNTWIHRAQRGDFTQPKAVILSQRREGGFPLADQVAGQGILPIAKSTVPGFAEWRLPGHGEPYVDCGSWRSKGCLNVEAHNQEGILEHMVGKAFVRRYQRTCLRADCPTCYESWAGKEAGKIQDRLRRSPKKGRPIHLIVSPSMLDIARLSYEELRRKSYVISKTSGFKGGCCIPHPWRELEGKRGWEVSPHFHMIGFGWIKGTKEGYEKHGWVVKNARIRKTVSGTALYLLSHAGIHPKHHTVTWFGALAYNKLRIPPQEPEKEVCPICGEPLRDLWYFGSEKLPEERGISGWIQRVLCTNPGDFRGVRAL